MKISLELILAAGGVSPIFLVIFFLVGALLFVFGFRAFREYRLLADTPQMPVRSVAMGLVHVHGKSTGGEPLQSPLTRVPCYYYRLLVEKWVKTDKGGNWETSRTDTGEREFYLEDSTGRILVNPQGAEYEVPRTFLAEIGAESNHARKIDASLGVAGPGENDLWVYLTTDFSRARQALAGSGIQGAGAIDKVLAVGEELQSLGVTLRGGGIGMDIGDRSQTYRFTEHCLLAGRECNVLGTCAENPGPKDEHDRNILMKGKNEKTFLITTEAEKQIESSLKWRAFGLILAGAACMIGAVALGLRYSGLL